MLAECLQPSRFCSARFRSDVRHQRRDWFRELGFRRLAKTASSASVGSCVLSRRDAFAAIEEESPFTSLSIPLLAPDRRSVTPGREAREQHGREQSIGLAESSRATV